MCFYITLIFLMALVTIHAIKNSIFNEKKNLNRIPWSFFFDFLFDVSFIWIVFTTRKIQVFGKLPLVRKIPKEFESFSNK